MKTIGSIFTRFWSTDRSLTILLILLVLTIFGMYPLYGIRYFRLIPTALFALILVSGTILVLRRLVLSIAVGILVSFSILINWLELFSPDALAKWSILFNLTCCGLLLVIILYRVFREERVTLNHILGAVAVYLLLALLWAYLYQAIALLSPHAFEGTSAWRMDSINKLQRELIYFSFVTITTVGYGDVLAVHPFARMLVMAEALIGQLFPAIFLARLVSIEILHSQRQ